MMKKNECAKCKIKSIQINCVLCQNKFCSNYCLINHLKENHHNENKADSIMNILTQQKKNSIASPYLVLGEYINDLKPPNSLYDFKNFEILKIGKRVNVIGRGSFGEVLAAKNKLNNQIYAIKQMRKETILKVGASLDFVLKEINIHRRLIHNNIIKLHSYHEDKENYYLIMDFTQKGNLYQKLKKDKFFDETTAFNYFIQTCSAVNFLHSNNLVHRDLKPENLLLDDNNNIKLCDFGWCVELNLGNRVTFCGTYEYMAPEIVNELPYNNSIDIWSLGILLYELIHGYSPFKNKDSNQNDYDYIDILKNIKLNKLVIDKKVSDDCSDLITKLLSHDMNDRIKMKDIFSHPWVKSYEKNLTQEKEKRLIPPNSAKENIITNRNTSVTIFSSKSRKTNTSKQFSKEEIINSEIKKKIKMIIGKDNEDASKLKNDLFISKETRETTNIFDKVLKKVEEKSRVKRIEIQKSLNNENNINFKSPASRKASPRTKGNDKKTEIEEVKKTNNEEMKFDITKFSENQYKEKEKEKEKSPIYMMKNIRLDNKVVNIRKEAKNSQVNLIKKKEFNRNKINTSNQLISENLSKNNKSYELGNNMMKNNEKLIKEILNKASKIDKSNIIGNSNSKITRQRVPVTENKDMELKKSHSRQKSLDLKFETKKIDDSLKRKKLERINQAALEVLNKTENVILAPTTQEKENTFWDKIANFFNPFKCGNN